LGARKVAPRVSKGMSGQISTSSETVAKFTYARDMTTSSAVPVEEYLRTTYHPDMEYLDGQLVERHVGEYFHSRLQLLIATALASRERKRGFRVFTELRIQVADRRYRIPDICVKALPHHVTPVLRQPDLAIEVISPDDEPADMLAKIDDYLAAGIPHIWIIDPYKRTIVEADQRGIRQSESQTLSTPLVGEIDIAAMFRDLDEPAE
jgi:Uma2 family endonuclease